MYKMPNEVHQVVFYNESSHNFFFVLFKSLCLQKVSLLPDDKAQVQGKEWGHNS